MKYGLYEYATLDTAEALRRFVVRVEDNADTMNDTIDNEEDGN